MSTCNAIEYMSLSALAYINFSNYHIGWTVGQLMSGKAIPEDDLNKPELIALKEGANAIQSWKLINFQPNTTSGFAAAAFQNPDTKEIVFAFRGTEPNKSIYTFLQDAITDAQLAVSGNALGKPNQFNDAFAFFDKTLKNIGKGNYSGYSFTGHSLGGGIAQYMTYITNKTGKSVTFDAVGIGQAMPHVDPASFKGYITDYVNQNDIIGEYGVQLGDTIYLKDTSKQDGAVDEMSRHLIAEIVNKARANSSTPIPPEVADAVQKALFGKDSQGSKMPTHELGSLLENGKLSEAVAGSNVTWKVNALQGAANVSSFVANGVKFIFVDIPLAEIKITIAVTAAAIEVAAQVGGSIIRGASEAVGIAAGVLADAIATTTKISESVALGIGLLLGGDVYIKGTDEKDDIEAWRTNGGLALKKAAYVEAFGGDDKVKGTELGDTIYAGSGNDYVKAEGGDDFVSGGSGNDFLIGDEGNDVLIGGEGDDFLEGEEGNDRLYGNRGNDSLSGGSGNDLFVGGIGDDESNDHYGDDTYVYNLGDGHDKITDYDGTDTLIFGSGIKPADVKLRRVESFYGDSGIRDYDLVLYVGDSGSVTIKNYYGFQGWFWYEEMAGNKIEKVVFADGTVWNENDIRAMTHVSYGTDGKDTLTAFDDYGFTFYGLADADCLIGRDGDDTLYGGDGDDTIGASGGNNILSGGAGNDTLTSSGYKKVGNDTYLFDRGDGHDTIYEYSGFDKIQFGDTIKPNDVSMDLVVENGAYYNLVLSICGGKDSITIIDHFGEHSYSGYERTPSREMEEISFADGTVWTRDYIYHEFHNRSGTDGQDRLYSYDGDRVVFRGLAGNDSLAGSRYDDELYGDDGEDTLIGNAGMDTLQGGAGDDSIDGGDGADLITGGAGNDRLWGGADSDTYVFEPGHGNDYVRDYNGAADTFLLGYTRDSIIFGYEDYYNMKIRYKNSKDSISVDSWKRDDGIYKIETMKSSDGYSISSTQIESLIQAMSSFEKDSGMTWEQAILERPLQVQSIVSQYWTAPTA